ncbi:hypothetical protein LR48_Vigan08g029700 [Vigna angularis]|uniref:Aminotransferase-like plant mobile domain-containing protein n=1 Tax=Phaseolus angularis TaxID=3914 RepID=A0A0L9V358_PHAAN|nr:hypothetical protein LR48_Vigan08g029700 [Vigna angularis]
MKSKFVGTLNEVLSMEQKSMISNTPFCWFLELKENVKISRNVLNELLIRWVDESGCFRFGERVVELKAIDVCLSLGLSVVGENIKLKEKQLRKSPFRKFFGDGKQDLQMIYDFLMKKHKKLSSAHFCSLYILVGISEFLIPNRSRTIFPILFEIVDTLSDLGTYCWARIVYQYLVSGLSKAFISWKKGDGASSVYVNGCVYVLQVWFCDRFIPSNVRVEKYLRLLHWMNINVGDNFIKSVMERGVMVDDYGASSKEISELIVEASVNKNGDDLNDQNKRKHRSKHREAIMAALDDQDTLIEELEEELSELQAELVSEMNEDEGGYRHDGGYSTPCEQHDTFNDFARQGGIYNNESVIKEGRRRKRYKSRVCRTPYTGYSPKLE